MVQRVDCVPCDGVCAAVLMLFLLFFGWCDLSSGAEISGPITSIG
jgi:hypothetical protein